MQGSGNGGVLDCSSLLHSHLQSHVDEFLNRFRAFHVDLEPGDFGEGARIRRNAHVKHRVHQLHVLGSFLRERLGFPLKALRKRSGRFVVRNLDPIFVTTVTL